MKLHKLEVEGLGPFAARQEVDFDSLGRAGLFLLSGPTGSGKTSVLDAVTFALYGQMLGARERAGDPVSHHRSLSTTPSVTLEATLGERRVRVRRVPTHARPKARGEGETTEQAKASLQVLKDGEWDAVSSRAQEVNQTLEEWVGMSCDQFCQVVILPQGEFATFLRAGAKDRREVLKRLFPTHDFRFVEDWLRDRAKEARRACDEKRQEIGNAIAAVAAVRRVDDEEEAEGPEPGDREAVEAWVEAARKELHAACKSLGAELAKARKADEEAAEHLQKAQERATAIEDHAKAEKQARASWSESTKLVRSLSRRELPEELDLADPEATRDSEQEVRGEVTRLSTFEKESLARRSECSQEVEKAAGRVEELERTLAEIEDFLAKAPERRKLIEAELAESTKAAGGLDAARKQVESLREQAEAARDRDAFDPRIEQADKEIERLRDEAHKAREYWLELRQARLDGIAAELAGALEEGVACPVCGSEHHPAPAPQGDGQVTESEEESARLAHEQAGAQIEEARQARSYLARELARLDTLPGSAAAEELSEKARQAADDLRRLEESAGRSEALSEDLRTLDEECERRRKEKSDGSAEMAKLRERIESHEKEIAKIDELEDSLRRDDPSVPERRSRLERLADALEAAADHAADAARETAAKAAAEHRRVPVSLEEAQEAKARAAAERDRVGELEANARQRMESFTLESGRLPGLHAELDPLEAESRTVNALADLANGRNEKRLQLSTYVLAARLEQVIGEANERLRPMSGGRYELVYSAERESHNRESGLGIKVLDGHTGEARETVTLSGGESFYASLALALGLAEVVQREAGGRRLETLFIDEGFGSLDSESLNDVMAILDELREGGRAVGVVSHVEEMRERIDAKIEVTPGPNGSNLALTGVA